tara:strand:- start:39 stop:875 length:837 start_codon:yes stop_codon:yes gene_type:complete
MRKYFNELTKIIKDNKLLFIVILIGIILLCVKLNSDEKDNTSICIIIPVTSNRRNWNNFEETYLHNYFLESFTKVYDPKINHLILLGIDDDDKLFNNDKIKNDIQKYLHKNQNIEIDFISTNGIKKGNVVHIWNRLFDEGINRGYDYFLQCGDDIEFYTHWEKDFITKLKSNNNIGAIGFGDKLRIQNNKDDDLATQSFVHKTHYNIFNYYFNPNIENHGCDDWLTGVYKKTNNYYYNVNNHKIKNSGGEPRYIPVNNRKLWDKLINEDYIKIINYQK